MAAAAGLNRGLLVSGDDEFLLVERPAGEAARIQVQHHPRLGGKLRIAREDPGVMLPGFARVGVQPAPQRGGGDALDQPGREEFLAQLAKAPAAKWHPSGGGQLTGDCLGLGNDRSGKHRWPAGPRTVPQAREPLLAEALAPLADGVRRDPHTPGDQRVRQSRSGVQDDPGADHLPPRGRLAAGPSLEEAALGCPQVDLERAAPACSCHPRLLCYRCRPGGRLSGWEMMGSWLQPSRSRPRSRCTSGCWTERASGGTGLPTLRCAFVASSPMSTVSLQAARSCRCAGCATAARPVCGGLPSTWPAATGTRTRYCQVVYRSVRPRRPWTAPAGCT